MNPVVKLQFSTMEIKIATGSKRHLGVVISTTQYKEEYMKGKIEGWIVDIWDLHVQCQIGRIESQAAYSYSLVDLNAESSTIWERSLV